MTILKVAPFFSLSAKGGSRTKIPDIKFRDMIVSREFSDFRFLEMLFLIIWKCLNLKIYPTIMSVEMCGGKKPII